MLILITEVSIVGCVHILVQFSSRHALIVMSCLHGQLSQLHDRFFFVEAGMVYGDFKRVYNYTVN